MKHTPECEAHTERVKAAIAEWTAKWPHYCRECNGRGGVSHHGYFDYRAGVGEPPSFEPCDTCTFHGLCPRCGEVGWADEADEGKPCRRCGWNYNDERPEHDICGCFDPFGDAAR